MSTAFPLCIRPLGFYPIVNRTEWLARFLPLGVRTAQLRIKDLDGEELEREIASATRLARKYNCQLFINDHWRLALKHQAYGVHLGQEDLDTADLELLRTSGLRLGLSTHCLPEVERARAIRPSYMAVGPIFPTTLKQMPFAPQGIASLGEWRKLVSMPLVAIGGLSLQHATEVKAAGADGIAVVSDVLSHPEPDQRVREWLEVEKSVWNLEFNLKTDDH